MKSTNSYALEIDSVVIYKFGALISGIQTIPDKKTSLDISLQVQEINLYESIFSPIIRAELAVIDPVGILFNFPLSGEEAVFIRYKNIHDNTYTTLYFIIDSVQNISNSEDARTMAYNIHCIALEGYANAKQTIQQGYHDTMPNIAKKVFDQHIVQRIKTGFPSYVPQPLIVENNDLDSYTAVIPNIHPFAAMQMLGNMSSENTNKFTYLFYQTAKNFNIQTLQGLFAVNQRGSSRQFAQRNFYKYMSNLIDDDSSKMNNDGRVITKLTVNKRLSSFQKMSQGYYHNNLFEINIAQKAVWGQPTKVEDIPTIYPNKLNTDTYTQLAYVEGDEEQSNRTKYVITTQGENNTEYPISRMRDKWGKDLIASNAMAQIDLTVVIPGTSIFTAGDLFSIEIPEVHGFNNVKQDDLITGLFVITEVKHILQHGGFHTTVLRINKDSYKSSIDRPSRFA